MRLLLAIYAGLLARLPEAFARLNAYCLGWVLWLLRRRIIQANLHAAFPDRSAAWVNRLGRTSCQRTAEMGLFSIASPLMSADAICQRIAIDPSMLTGPAALGSGGHVFFTPHFTLMEMMSAVKALDPGFAQRDWVVLYRPLNQAWAERWIREARERFGMRMVSRKEGFAQTMQAVRAGQIAVILFDQRAQQGSRIHFLGRPCAATELPGIIAQRFRASARIFWAERTGFWRCRLKLAALHATDAPGLTLESNAWLERQLREDEQACANWLWAHDRWKHGDSAAISDLRT